MAAPAGTRLAGLLAALSMVTDLDRGHPAEEAMGACLLGTALARRCGLSEADVADVNKTGVSTRAAVAIFATRSDLLDAAL